jgi:hypothetical protein
MDRIVKDKMDGWDISLQRNVHMYCHALSVKIGPHEFSIDCEDLVTEEKTIGIWLYNSKIPDAMVGELKKVLRKWASQYDVKFHIHTSKDEFVAKK